MRDHAVIAVEGGCDDFSAYLVVEACDRPISFGGTRVDPSVTLDMVADLAANMSLKLAIHGSPVGGAKAGVRAAPGDPKLGEYLRAFADTCRELLTSTTILGKDMGARQWMLDELYASLSIPQLGVAQRHFPDAGCPDRIGELAGYVTHMTGRGVFWAIDECLDGFVRGARVGIQGFGVVGAGVAWHLARAGARIVAVSDCDKAVVDGRGLDVDRLIAARDDNGILRPEWLAGLPLHHDRDEVLGHRCDVLVLAAGSHAVDERQASRIVSPVVVEAANLALTPEARQALHRVGMRVVPDVVANSSSAALVGHQIASGNRLAAEVVWAGIEDGIRRAACEVEGVARKLDIDSKAAVRYLMEDRRGPEITGEDTARRG